VVFDVRSGLFGLRIEPGGVVVALAIDDKLTIAGDALPGTHTLVVTGLE
jgi:hypothetical protein